MTAETASALASVTEQAGDLATALQVAGAILLVRTPLCRRLEEIRQRATAGESFAMNHGASDTTRRATTVEFARGERADVWGGVAAILLGAVIQIVLRLSGSQQPIAVLTAWVLGALLAVAFVWLTRCIGSRRARRLFEREGRP